MLIRENSNYAWNSAKLWQMFYINISSGAEKHHMLLVMTSWGQDLREFITRTEPEGNKLIQNEDDSIEGAVGSGGTRFSKPL